jgi:hypothetical protein
MRISYLVPVVAGLLLALAPRSDAQDDPRSIIEKAIKAHGGADKLAKLNAMEMRASGTLQLMGLTIPFTKETAAQISGQLKEVLELDINGARTTAVTVFDRNRGWISTNGVNVDMDDTMVREFQEAVYQMALGKLVFLNDSHFTVSPLGEIRVNDRPAAGIKVACPGHRDVRLYFDKVTGLMAKKETQTVDLKTHQEVSEETFIREFQEKDGLKTARRIEVRRDGNKILEAEVLDVRFPAKLDDDLFARPQ